MKPGSGVRTDLASTDAAIARVLHAERAARATIERTRVEVHAITERARRAAAARVERTEQRCRHVADCFDRDTAAQLAAIEARQALLTQPHALAATELDQLSAAVRQLAREMVGKP